MNRQDLIDLVSTSAQRRLSYAMAWRKDAALLYNRLIKWSKDPISWFEDCVYSPDPQNLFGGKSIPEQLTWSGMVPVIPFPHQKNFIQEVDAVVMEDPDFYAARGLDGIAQRLDYNLWKARQQAITTILDGLSLKWWLFSPTFHGLLLSYDRDAVDSGGKGDRTADSLFGRFRMQLDAFMWLYPNLQFNQQLTARQRTYKEVESLSGMTSSQDKGFKLTRPEWWLRIQGDDDIELFPRGKNNTIQGTVPSDRSGKSRSYSVAIFDEYGEYTPGDDRAAYNAISPCCQHNITVGTIPAGGGLSSHFYELSHTYDDDTLISKFFSWTHNLFYMAGAYFTCTGCKQKVDLPRSPGFDWDEIRTLTCPLCGKHSNVTHRDVRSSWFDSKTRRMSAVEIERYYWGGWVGAQTNLAFHGFDKVKAVVKRSSTKAWETHIGYDPGQSQDNPAALLFMRFSPAELRLRYIAHLAVAGWPTQKLVPYFKCWHPTSLSRERLIYGSPQEVGKTFAEQYAYAKEDLEILERLHEFSYGKKHYQADKYGSHNNAGTGTAFKILELYGIRPKHRYELERAKWIQKLQDIWVPRIEIEDTFSDYRPRHANGRYPSFADALATAQMVTGEGHGEVKYDISGKLPSKHVKDVIDALIYLSRGLPDLAHAQSDEAGNFSVQAPQKGESFDYAEEPTFG